MSTQDDDIRIRFEPSDLVFVANDKTVMRITPSRKVILETDIYEAAVGFWEVVKAMLHSQGWHLETHDS